MGVSIQTALPVNDTTCWIQRALSPLTDSLADLDPELHIYVEFVLPRDKLISTPPTPGNIDVSTLRPQPTEGIHLRQTKNL